MHVARKERAEESRSRLREKWKIGRGSVPTADLCMFQQRLTVRGLFLSCGGAQRARQTGQQRRVVPTKKTEEITFLDTARIPNGGAC